jgi:glycosyltransferase involved in cell wall biosynthesis
VRTPQDKERFGFEAADIVFGYVGRLVPIKDLDTLVRAFVQVAAAVPRARLLMVGDGECRATLEELASSLAVADAVRFVGWQSSLRHIHGAVDVAVLSSLNEGTPVAIIEAMAAGLPVVATSVGGVPDVVRNGFTGTLVPIRSPDRLAAAMEALAKDPELRRQMGEAARVDARAQFGADRLVSSVAALYVEELARKRRTA